MCQSDFHCLAGATLYRSKNQLMHPCSTFAPVNCSALLADNKKSDRSLINNNVLGVYCDVEFWPNTFLDGANAENKLI